MKIPNYDKASKSSNFTQLYPFMPSDTFRMLICGPSGCGKTNTLMDMLREHPSENHALLKYGSTSTLSDFVQILCRVSS